MDPQQVIDCWRGKDQHECLKTSANPHGVPIQREQALILTPGPLS